MTTEAYPKLGPVEFGRALLETGDLDPIYIALHKAEPTVPQLRRWLLAYWMFYHAGVASRLSEEEGQAFWDATRRADKEKWPRGRERRHFRAANSGRAIADLSARFPKPEEACRFAEGGDPATTLEAVSRRVQTWSGFGPWIAFKAADMIDRLGLCRVYFSSTGLGFYKEPAEGAKLAAPRFGIAGADQYKPLALTTMVVNRLMIALRPATAPPRHERQVSVPEVETVLCKWKAHMAGHYAVGSDTREIRASLEARDWGATAKAFLEALPS